MTAPTAARRRALLVLAALTVLLASFFALRPTNEPGTSLASAQGTDLTVCENMAVMRLRIDAIQHAPAPTTKAQREALASELAAIARRYTQGANDRAVPESIGNGMRTAASTYEHAIEETASRATASKVLDLLAATEPVNQNIARWCSRYSPPV